MVTKKERQAIELKARLDVGYVDVLRQELEHQRDAAAARTVAICEMALRELTAALVVELMAICERLDKLESQVRPLTERF